MESLRESNADQLVQITGQGAPAGVFVVTKTEQVDIPRHYYSQLVCGLRLLLEQILSSADTFQINNSG